MYKMRYVVWWLVDMYCIYKSSLQNVSMYDNNCLTLRLHSYFLVWFGLVWFFQFTVHAVWCDFSFSFFFYYCLFFGIFKSRCQSITRVTFFLCQSCRSLLCANEFLSITLLLVSWLMVLLCRHCAVVVVVVTHTDTSIHTHTHTHIHDTHAHTHSLRSLQSGCQSWEVGCVCVCVSPRVIKLPLRETAMVWIIYWGAGGWLSHLSSLSQTNVQTDSSHSHHHRCARDGVCERRWVSEWVRGR